MLFRSVQAVSFRLDRWERGRGQDRQLAASQQGRALATRLLQTWRLSFTSITRALCFLHSRQQHGNKAEMMIHFWQKTKRVDFKLQDMNKDKVRMRRKSQCQMLQIWVEMRGDRHVLCCQWFDTALLYNNVRKHADIWMPVNHCDSERFLLIVQAFVATIEHPLDIQRGTLLQELTWRHCSLVTHLYYILIMVR